MRTLVAQKANRFTGMRDDETEGEAEVGSAVGDEVVDLDDDALLEDDGSGWMPDPEVEGQERFWDGTEWTDQVRPVDEAVETDDEVDEDDEIFDLDDDALLEDDGSGWMPDPEVEGQERFWDGAEWTDQVRVVEEEPKVRGREALPDHVPELQRALAAATTEIDDVETRLSSLFDRGRGRRGAETAAQAPHGAPGAGGEGGPPIHEEFGGPSSEGGGDPMNMGMDGAEEIFGPDDDDEETFAELDAALAAEAPDEPDRRFFKRRS
jgi:hypothetical protein